MQMTIEPSRSPRSPRSVRSWRQAITVHRSAMKLVARKGGRIHRCATVTEPSQPKSEVDGEREDEGQLRETLH